MSYVPPHLRKKKTTDASPKLEDRKTFTYEEIRNHYKDTINQGSSTGTTLHDSADSPGQLSYVMLFHGANVRWESDRIIYVKTKLEILPGYQDNAAISDSSNAVEDKSVPVPSDRKSEQFQQAESPEDAETQERAILKDTKTLQDIPPRSVVLHEGNPIAVFHDTKVARQERYSERWEFIGYFRVERIAYLAPRSQELARMLEQKWVRTHGGTRTRSHQGWMESLSHEWAVVKFVELKGEEAPPAPKIELLPAEEKKSVNELLAQMRLGDKKGEEADQT